MPAGFFQRVFGKAPLALWQRAVLFPAAYWVCAEAGSRLSVSGSPFVTFWLPAGLFVAVLLLNPTRDWPWLALAAFPANFIFDYFHGTRPLLIIPFFYGVNAIQAVTGAWLVRRFIVERPTLATLREFIGLVGLAGGLSTMLGALLGAATLMAFGLNHSFLQSFEDWWGSTTMAVFILAPFMLTQFSQEEGADGRRIRPSRFAETVLLCVGLGGINWFLVARSEGVMSHKIALAVPVLLWAGLRFGVRGAASASLFFAVSLSFCTAQFATGLTEAQMASGDYVFSMQIILAMGALVAIVPAIVLGERDRTTAKLRESEERFRQLTQAAFEGIAISEKGCFLDANDQLLKMFGVTREEIIGRKIVDFVAPESRELVAEAIRTGKESNYEHRLLRKDGSSFYAEAQAKVVHVGGRGLRMTAVRDITDRKKAEQELRESVEKFSKAFRTGPDVMSISDFATGRYLDVNEAHEKIFGFKREEVIGRSPLELGILEDASVREAMLEELKARGSLHEWEIHTRARDGRQLTMLHSAELIEIGGRMCALRVSHDITDRKHAEAEREAAVAREEQARREYTLQLIASQEAERARVAAELHDSLGQNLSIIKNRAQLALQQNGLPAAAREQVEAVGDLTAQAIAEVRRISRDLHPYQLDHLGLTRALDALIESTSAASSIEFNKKFDAVDDMFPPEAATSIYRIVQEGLNNILKYSGAKHARVTLERDVHEAQLTIADDGRGFAAGSTAANGRGLGLKNIAQRVQMVGGNLKLESAPGKGVRIEITIPISAGPE